MYFAQENKDSHWRYAVTDSEIRVQTLGVDEEGMDKWRDWVTFSPCHPDAEQDYQCIPSTFMQDSVRTADAEAQRTLDFHRLAVARLLDAGTW